MKTYPCLLVVAALVAGGCQSNLQTADVAAQNNITVTFKNPDNFTDARESFAGSTSQYYLDVLSKHLKEVAARRLPAGQKLTVTFTDIDLAGDFIPGGRAGQEDIRFIKSVYIPHMALTFQLTDANGAVIKEGERRLTDLNFQLNMDLVGRNEPLYYDKPLLDRWVEREFKG